MSHKSREFDNPNSSLYIANPTGTTGTSPSVAPPGRLLNLLSLGPNNAYKVLDVSVAICQPQVIFALHALHKINPASSFLALAALIISR